ncbi:MAG TPA: hypothetical protein ENN06_10535 [Desulfobacteraceae bacterium]|nr:hypothetical protein [Desulfobacteraceae bacterium]
MQTSFDNFLFRTSVTPEGKFLVAVHHPSFEVANLREHDKFAVLGYGPDGTAKDNRRNFPEGDVRVVDARPIYEIPNAFPFRGATYIDSGWADARAENPSSIGLPPASECSLRRVLASFSAGEEYKSVLSELPRPLLYTLAACSTDPDELVLLADFCCRFEYDQTGRPKGLLYRRDNNGRLRPGTIDLELFETVANNPFLPDPYKEVMVLRPGVQGDSEVVGDWSGDGSRVVEYLRANSYIPWGHYASNMASDAVRYRTADLTEQDMRGLRHLYYQRVYVALAAKAGLEVPVRRRRLTAAELEELRLNIMRSAAGQGRGEATLWGWNYGYDFSGSGYRLHASHQMIHQQYALVPESTAAADGETVMPAFGIGDLVADTVDRYRLATGSDFFRDLLAAVRGNTRTDGGGGEHNLVVWEDENVLLFVPKAQVSQWELQLMASADTGDGPVGNVVEADEKVRRSLDRGILTAQHIYAGLNARMVTSIELPKRLGSANGQRLLYSFLPKLPWSMGGLSEAQLRFICGHYPEDFAACCRQQLTSAHPGVENNSPL